MTSDLLKPSHRYAWTERQRRGRLYVRYPAGGRSRRPALKNSEKPPISMAVLKNDSVAFGNIPVRSLHDDSARLRGRIISGRDNSSVPDRGAAAVLGENAMAQEQGSPTLPVGARAYAGRLYAGRRDSPHQATRLFKRLGTHHRARHEFRWSRTPRFRGRRLPVVVFAGLGFGSGAIYLAMGTPFALWKFSYALSASSIVLCLASFPPAWVPRQSWACTVSSTLPCWIAGRSGGSPLSSPYCCSQECASAQTAALSGRPCRFRSWCWRV